MRKAVLFLVIVMLWLLSANICTGVYAADEWVKAEPTGARAGADIDAYIAVNNEALDRLLSNYQTCNVKYASVATLTVSIGEAVCSNSDGSLRKFRANTSATTVAWTDIDVSSEGSSTTYYVFAVADTDATTFTVKVSTSSTTPSGCSYYKKLGSFYNNSDGDIEQVSDGLRMKMAIGTGTVADAATIPLPTGYAESECKWLVSVYSLMNWDDGDNARTHTINCTADSSRVVDINSDGHVDYDGTANYIIVGYRDNI